MSKRPKKSIYESPKRYAKLCCLPLDLARIQCRKFKRIMKKAREIRCPICHKRTLEWIPGSYEEGYDSFIECSNCGSDFDGDEIPNSELIGDFGEAFDDILFYSLGESKEDRLKHRMEYIGTDNYEGWVKFARHSILSN